MEALASLTLACVGTRLPWVLDKVTAPVEKHFGPSAVKIKSGRAAGSLFDGVALALVLGDVEEGEVLCAELAGGEVKEVVDLRHILTERADDKA